MAKPTPVTTCVELPVILALGYGMPHWLDENSWWFPPNPFLAWVTDFESPELKPRSLMQRAFELGGLQQFTLTLNADESGLLLQLSLGEALANHLLARFKAVQV